jgi:hypothetical protein
MCKYFLFLTVIAFLVLGATPLVLLFEGICSINRLNCDVPSYSLCWQEEEKNNANKTACGLIMVSRSTIHMFSMQVPDHDKIHIYQPSTTTVTSHQCEITNI